MTCNSHATAYGLTAYVGAWLKTYYPTAFYTVVLRDQDEDKMAVLMNEIKTVGGTELEKPNINISGENFTADFKNNKIYWSLSRIKQLGPKAVKYIVQERNLYGEFMTWKILSSVSSKASSKTLMMKERQRLVNAAR